ncbi:hypothetical protein ACERII_18870 [Evansella sp. AB-rgal1]|uniref:hypothetical protein n=1 Tax=Evansella sp. AB-rgal1 TaxID=3242696 RepID=UPI00359D81DD
MSVLPKLSVEYKKKYALKSSNVMIDVLNPFDFHHYREGENNNISWKWIQLPMKVEGKKLNKLVFHNKKDESVSISLLINYDLTSNSEKPVVYYSPSKEALIIFDGKGYRLYGGVTEYSSNFICCTDKVDLQKWLDGIPLQFQPLIKESNGWAIELELNINPSSSSYIYEWEFQSSNLQELEELHSQYRDLLLNQRLSN